MVSSATEAELAAGVFITVIPLDCAYSTSMLSSPTPPRTITWRSLPASMIFSRTLVRPRTTIP